MTRMQTGLSLNKILAVDAVTCLAMGILLITATGPIAALTGMPSGLLFWAGILLLPTAAFMGIHARCRPVPGWATAIAVIGNAGWVAASVALPILNLIEPNLLGWFFLTAQAAVVALLAVLEHKAARPSASAA